MRSDSTAKQLCTLVEKRRGVDVGRLTTKAKKCLSTNTEPLIPAGVYFGQRVLPGSGGPGLIRQYFPKDTDFTKVSYYQIKKVERRLNGRPRAVLNYEKPIEVINRLVALKA